MKISSIMVVRVAVAAMFIIHGVARVIDDAVTPFGPFLESRGLPFGLAWAWAVTLIEIAGGTLLALGRYTAPLAAYFIIQTALGIWWVHWNAGWFVVGLGRNGMEYSALLIACLVAVLLGKK
ncbi:MAG: DoxX family protein [Pseudomonadota bacterium]|nr:DoxX family protein [Pseudomonadota bacterium]